MMQCRAIMLTPSVAQGMAAAGAEEVWLGVESGAQHVLNAMEKGTTVSEIREATRALKTAGIRACWFLQLGYPGEDWTDIVATRNLVRDERPDDIGVSVAYPLPGTKYATVRAQLGLRQHWEHSDSLAMLFRGTYSTALYRKVRDVLHDETRSGANDERWTLLEREAGQHLSARSRSFSPAFEVTMASVLSPPHRRSTRSPSASTHAMARGSALRHNGAPCGRSSTANSHQDRASSRLAAEQEKTLRGYWCVGVRTF